MLSWKFSTRISSLSGRSTWSSSGWWPNTAATKHGVAVNSGTSGLHLLIRAYGIGDGDEVITTPFSFIASSNCILYERARPVFVDIEPDTANIDVTLMEEAVTPRTKAVLAVDAFGQPARLDAIREVAERHGLVFIEDSCESLGSEYKGKKAGGPDFAHAAVFAFYPNKQITTGEGGLIVTDDDRIAQLCDSMCNQGRKSGLWLAPSASYNYGWTRCRPPSAWCRWVAWTRSSRRAASRRCARLSRQKSSRYRPG